MPIEITQLTDEDIPSAVECIQEAFKDDPYNNWVFHPLSSFSKTRNTHSLTLRCKWGQKHALFHVAKETSPTSPILLASKSPRRSLLAPTQTPQLPTNLVILFRRLVALVRTSKNEPPPPPPHLPHHLSHSILHLETRPSIRPANPLDRPFWVLLLQHRNSASLRSRPRNRQKIIQTRNRPSR
ncbi:unnamed protein product [Cercospora beticola]|nr:unnamed protein product [Cercospora beticola]